jgi:hypothetical protein
VKQKQAARPKLRQPDVEVVPNRRFGMQAVEMKEVD